MIEKEDPLIPEDTRSPLITMLDCITIMEAALLWRFDYTGAALADDARKALMKLLEYEIAVATRAKE